MSSTATLEIEKAADAREQGVFFKCPVGGFASLRPGVCPKCGELLQSISASPASIDNDTDRHMPDTAYTSSSDHEAEVDGDE